jgi:hypothetical protein
MAQYWVLVGVIHAVSWNSLIGFRTLSQPWNGPAIPATWKDRRVVWSAGHSEHQCGPEKRGNTKINVFSFWELSSDEKNAALRRLSRRGITNCKFATDSSPFMTQSAVDLRNRDVFGHLVIGQIMEHLHCTVLQHKTEPVLTLLLPSLPKPYIWHVSPERYSHSERRQGCHEDQPLPFFNGRRKST